MRAFWTISWKVLKTAAIAMVIGALVGYAVTAAVPSVADGIQAAANHLFGPGLPEIFTGVHSFVPATFALFFALAGGGQALATGIGPALQEAKALKKPGLGHAPGLSQDAGLAAGITHDGGAAITTPTHVPAHSVPAHPVSAMEAPIAHAAYVSLSEQFPGLKVDALNPKGPVQEASRQLH